MHSCEDNVPEGMTINYDEQPMPDTAWTCPDCGTVYAITKKDTARA